MQLKFNFANFDNAASPLVIDVTPDTSIASIRATVFERWPLPNAQSKPDSVSGLRLFCMGKALDAKTIGECNLPSFDFPTPVHVAAKPSSRPQPAASGQAKSSPSGGGGGGGCCIVM